jgi:hypothetical protein
MCGNPRLSGFEEAEVSVSDVVWVVWLIPALAGVALGLRLRSSLLALLLGFVLVIVGFHPLRLFHRALLE